MKRTRLINTHTNHLIFQIPICLVIICGMILSSCQQPLDNPQEEVEENEEDQLVVVSKISLDASRLDLIVGEERDLHVSFLPDEAQPLALEWESMNTDIATVKDGKVKAIYPGNTSIIVKADNPKLEASCMVVVEPDMSPVDLGLGALWAPMNLGASSPSETGDYFAWGEVTPKTDYSLQTYKYYNGTKRTKYYDDRKYILDNEDDAARVIWGDGWRIPTEPELQQLIDYCKWEPESLNGADGFRVTGPSGQSIFLPLTGAFGGTEKVSTTNGWYWSNEMTTLALAHSPSPIINDTNSYCLGLSIRPVKSITLESVSINAESIIVNLDERKPVPLTIKPSLGTPACLEWKSENEDIALVSDGEVLGLKVGQTRISAKSLDGAHSVNCMVTVQDWKYPEAKSIDLGLSVEWASWNLGASCPEEAGDYFAWGETEHKAFFSEDNYRFFDDGKLIKYSVDNPTLVEEDDVATDKWSNGWRMPTGKEIKELVDNCTWTWTELNGVEGVMASRNGNFIFFPASPQKRGYIEPRVRSYSTDLYLISASLEYTANRPSVAYLGFLHKEPNAVQGKLDAIYYGFHIRPVRFLVSHDLSLNLKRFRLEEGETLESITPEKGKGAESLSWHNSDESVVSRDNSGKLLAKKEGKSILTATAERGGGSASCEVVVGKWSYPVAEAVDLGLSVKWASWNIGATCRGDLGDFIFWAVPGHHVYDKYDDYNSHLKSSYYNGEKFLKKEDDVAYVKWGPGWRTPSKADYDELINKCSKEYAYIDNNHGIIFTGPNGNSIFLPAAPGLSSCGWNMEHIYSMGQIHNGFYWTREISDTGIPYAFWFMQNWTVGKELSDTYLFHDFLAFTYGFTIRAVYEQ